jgi:hypothetical protein
MRCLKTNLPGNSKREFAERRSLKAHLPDKTPMHQDGELTSSIQLPWLIVCTLLALPFTFLFLLLSDIRWTSEGVEHGPSTHLSFIPANCLVLTHVVLLLMWWTSFCLRICGLFRMAVKY